MIYRVDFFNIAFSSKRLQHGVVAAPPTKIAYTKLNNIHERRVRAFHVVICGRKEEMRTGDEEKETEMEMVVTGGQADSGLDVGMLQQNINRTKLEAWISCILYATFSLMTLLSDEAYEGRYTYNIVQSSS